MRNYQKDFSDFSPFVYLDCARQGPFPVATAERLHQAIELKSHPDRLLVPEYFGLPDRVRARLARLIGADAGEIVIATSATQGIGIPAAGLRLGTGDEVVVSSSNFPSNLFTWIHLQRKGVTVKVIHSAGGEVTLDQVAAQMTSRTRVLALDWVNYSSGYRIDLAAFGSLIHERGGIFVVDGSQAVGANDLNLHSLPVDIMACGAYKWLLGPFGSGFAYVARDLLDKLDVPVINWYSVEGAHNFDSALGEDFTLIPEARVFDSGETASFINLSGFEASLEYLQNVTVNAVNAHCRQLLGRLEDGLRVQGYMLSMGATPSHESAILGFRAPSPEATAALHQKISDHKILISLRRGMIRVSPNLYNNEADIERLLELSRPA